MNLTIDEITIKTKGMTATVDGHEWKLLQKMGKSGKEAKHLRDIQVQIKEMKGSRECNG